MKKTALIAIGDGFEEIETVLPLDILRRGGVEVTLAGCSGRDILLGAHKIGMKIDCLFSEVSSNFYDCLILPGGPGCYNLRGIEQLRDCIVEHFKRKKLTCAICAAPLLFHDAGVLKGKKYTAHPCTHNELERALVNQCVVVDGNLITGIGPGAAAKFGFAILEHLTNAEISANVMGDMLFEND